MTQAAMAERGGLVIVDDDQEQTEQYIEQLGKAREALERGQYDALAVTTPESSPACILARELGGIAIDPHENYQETLMASSDSRRRETGVLIASVLPLQVRGEPRCIPYEDDEGYSTLAAIMENRRRAVAGKVNLPYLLDDGTRTSVVMAIVSN